MTKSLYFHIGMGRCGSSAIQTLGARNRDKLCERGLGYPHPVDLGAQIALNHGNGTGIALILREEGGAGTPAIQAIQRMCDHLRSVPSPKVLVSSEFFFSLPTEQFRKLKESFDRAGLRATIICYIREQREWMISRYAQAIKSRHWTKCLEDYMLASYKTRGLNYRWQCRRLIEVFGADNLIIRIFERERLRGADVRRDVLSIIGIDSEELDFGEDDLNASANLLQLELMRVMNANAGRHHFRFRNEEFLRETRDICASGEVNASRDLYRLVPPVTMNRLGAFFDRQNERFREEFFPNVEAPLFKSRIPTQYAVFDASERFSADSIVVLSHYFDRCCEKARSPRLKRNAGPGAKPRRRRRELATLGDGP